MYRLKELAIEVAERFKRNELNIVADALAFRLILSIFPLILFMISLLGMLNLSYDRELTNILASLPDEMQLILQNFIKEVGENTSYGLLSTSLIVALISASSGFYGLVRGIKKAYDEDLINKFIKMRLQSILLVIIFVACIVLTLYVFTFGSVINDFIVKIGLIQSIPSFLTGFFMYFLNAFVMFVFLIILNMFCVKRKLPFRRLIPGTLITMGSWMIISKLFNIYISNFSRYNIVYGSIGTLFVFALWINIFSYVLLLGGQINAVFCDDNYMIELISYH